MDIQNRRMHTDDLSFINTNRYKLALCLTTSIFFYLFLIFFLPFGVDNYNPSHQYTPEFLLEIFYFFFSILAFLLLNEFLLQPLFIKKITFKKVFIWSLWTFIFISTVIFFTYNILGNWHDFHFRSYLSFCVNCSAILIFPVLGTFFFFQYGSLQQHVDHILTAKENSLDSGQLITFSGQGSKDQISLSIGIFLYGRAQDNYVELYYLEHQKLSKYLLRSSISNLVASIDHPAIIRCHRSYIINLYHVKAVKGGSKEFSLQIDPFDTLIPVSRSYRQSVITQLRVLKNFD